MPKKAREMSAVEVRRLSRAGYHPVGGVSGLLLQVTQSGAKSWILRFRLGGRRRDLGLGAFPDVPLAQARDRAREARDRIAQGIDPVEARREAKTTMLAQRVKTLTFDEATPKFLATKAKEFRNPKHAKDWPSSLNRYASPIIGNLSVAQIELAHVVSVLDPIWTTKTETATRVRGRIEAVLNWATVSGYRAGPNPAQWKGNLDAVLGKPGKLKNVKHYRAVAIKDTPGFLKDLRRREGISARALEFIILTVARSGEVRGATWGEIDFEAKIWTVPGSRMKAGRDHVVPLTDDALTLLKALPRHEGCDFVFASPRLGQLSDMSISAVMRRMEVDAVPHGFRSTFRDWASEFTNHPHEVAEMALAHTISNAVERAYRRGDLLGKRRSLMDDWCRFINSVSPRSTESECGAIGDQR
jgi:integrase